MRFGFLLRQERRRRSFRRSGGPIVIETDPYSILGVARGCTPGEAREAYRAGVRATHPDHGGDGAAFIRLCAAYRQVVEELGQPAEYPGGPSHSGSASASASASASGPDRKAYVAWVREHARNSSRRRSRSRGRRRRSRDERPWWRRHPKAARGILFGLVAAFGLSILGFTLLVGPALIDRAGRRARERSRAGPARPPSSRVQSIAEVPATRPDAGRRDDPRGGSE